MVSHYQYLLLKCDQDNWGWNRIVTTQAIQDANNIKKEGGMEKGRERIRNRRKRREEDIMGSDKKGKGKRKGRGDTS